MPLPDGGGFFYASLANRAAACYSGGKRGGMCHEVWEETGAFPGDGGGPGCVGAPFRPGGLGEPLPGCGGGRLVLRGGGVREHRGAVRRDGGGGLLPKRAHDPGDVRQGAGQRGRGGARRGICQPVRGRARGRLLCPLRGLGRGDRGGEGHQRHHLLPGGAHHPGGHGCYAVPVRGSLRV